MKGLNGITPKTTIQILGLLCVITNKTMYNKWKQQETKHYQSYKWCILPHI